MRVATWNILNGTSLTDGKVDAARLQAAAGSLDVDLLGIQEVDRGQPRSGLLDLTAEVAEGLGAGHHRYLPSLVGTPGGSWRAADGAEVGNACYGIGLVSRFPVRSWHEKSLGRARVTAPILLPDRRLMWLKDEPRVALAAVVDGPDGPLTVCVTHLSFVPFCNAWQLRRLVGWLGGLPGPTLLMGDLNLPVGAGLVSGLDVLARAKTYPAPQPKVQLDHVLGRGVGPALAVETPVVDVSDHLPLVVTL